VDLKDIESWGRELLEHEAAKRGVRSPQVYSRTELVRLILKHDYGAPTNMKEAARLIGGLLGSAKQALRKRLDAPLQGRSVKTYVGAGKQAPWHEDVAPGTSERSPKPSPSEVQRGVDAANASDETETPETTELVGVGTLASESDDVERSYVGDRPLELPGVNDAGEPRVAARLGRSLMPRQRTAATESGVAPTEKAARERAEEELERSHVSGLRLELAAAAERDAVRAAFDAVRAEEDAAPRIPEQLTFEAREAPAQSEPAPSPRAHLREEDDALREEGDALREAERVREDAREARRESDRVRADARAAGQHEADWQRPAAGWHKVKLAPSADVNEARAEGDESQLPAKEAQPSAAGLSATEQAKPGSGDSGVHRAPEIAALSEAEVAQREAAARGEREKRDSERALREPALREAARGEAAEFPFARDSRQTTADSESTPDAARGATAVPASVPHLRLVEPLPAPAAENVAGEGQRGGREDANAIAITSQADESHQTTPGTVASAPQIEPAEHITYGPHPPDGMLLRWRVTPEAIKRARKLLGSNGELAVRIVAIRVEPHAVVKTDVIDHGPIADSGDWTAPLLPAEARYVSSVGLKSANKFVSIVHATS
jgi:hypothetical protein